MTNDELELSSTLTRLVRATTGVHDVYAVGGILAVAAKAATNTLDNDARVAITGDTVTVSVAVAAGFTAPETLRAVSATIAQHLTAVGRPTDKISVRASRIE